MSQLRRFNPRGLLQLSGWVNLQVLWISKNGMSGSLSIVKTLSMDTPKEVSLQHSHRYLRRRTTNDLILLWLHPTPYRPRRHTHQFFDTLPLHVFPLHQNYPRY